MHLYDQLWESLVQMFDLRLNCTKRTEHIKESSVCPLEKDEVIANILFTICTCVLLNKCSVCLRQSSRDVQTTLNILYILSELLTVGEHSLFIF